MGPLFCTENEKKMISKKMNSVKVLVIVHFFTAKDPLTLTKMGRTLVQEL